MATVTVTQWMPQLSAVVFGLFHDYKRRLKWDTLLREARLTRGHLQAGKGATSIFIGKLLFGIVGIETEYITFTRSSIAAVKMINRPLFFEDFSASIRYKDVASGSKLVYKLQFSAKPRILRGILYPVMKIFFRRETQKWLQSLSTFLDG